MRVQNHGSQPGIILLILALVIPLARAHGDQEVPLPRPQPAGSSGLVTLSARDVIRNFFLVRLLGENDRCSVHLFTRDLPLETLVCAADSPPARLATDVLLAERCGEREDGFAPFKERLREVVQGLQDEFATELASCDARSVPALERRISARFQEILESSPWAAEFAASWRKHVLAHSSCYLAERKKLLARRKELARQQGITCGDWLTYLGFCTADSDDPADHVKFSLGASPSPRIVRAVRALAEARLPRCLGMIVSRDDPGLAEMIRTLRPRAAERARTDIVNRRARLLWRARGVDRWFERTVAAGEVPEDVRREIEACAAGKLPSPVGTARGSGDPGPDRREGR